MTDRTNNSMAHDAALHRPEVLVIAGKNAIATTREAPEGEHGRRHANANADQRQDQTTDGVDRGA